MSYEDYYEQRKTVDEYLAFHYPVGDPLQDLLGAAAPSVGDRFPVALRRLWGGGGLALDVGAAVGRMTFELAQDHGHAVGIDLSHALIRAAKDVQRTGQAVYRTQVEGDLEQNHNAEVENPGNTTFMVGNALSLSFPAQTFDTVIALNLVDRVPDPGRALDELARVTRQGGTLIIASPYTWLEDYTPKGKWLGGFVRNQAPVHGIEAVRGHLSSVCEPKEELRLPFFIPHHARSGQLGVSLVQSFERKS